MGGHYKPKTAAKDGSPKSKPEPSPKSSSKSDTKPACVESTVDEGTKPAENKEQHRKSSVLQSNNEYEPNIPILYSTNESPDPMEHTINYVELQSHDDDGINEKIGSKSNIDKGSVPRKRV